MSTTVEPSRVPVTGPLAPYADGFCEELAAQGYMKSSAVNQVRLMARVSRWLVGEGLGAGDLTSERLEQFLEARRRAGYTTRRFSCGLATLLGYLRGLGVVPEPTPRVAESPVEKLLDEYRSYLLAERGLAPSTVRSYERVAAVFLDERSGLRGLDLDGLTAGDVTRFVIAECAEGHLHPKELVPGLRSLLRFLHVEGRVSTDLSRAVPAVAGWRGGSLPRGLEPKQVEAMLATCDRRIALGRRDHAVLVVLARLGLRAGEVAALTLDDVDWRAGEVLVRGKGDRQERLPLPVDVGEALAGYLHRGRPRGDSRALFLRVRAPHGGLSSAGIASIVARACEGAGLSRVGPHRLRHTVATEMLRAGASLPEVAQVLRHSCLDTTAIYAKVDFVALSALARPWPGGAR